MQEKNKSLKDKISQGIEEVPALQSFFLNSELLDHFVKKSERITAALHLITNFFDSSEPVRLKIRTLSLDVVSDTVEMSFTAMHNKKAILLGLSKKLQTLKVTLGVLHTGSMVSPMNYQILYSEIEDLLKLVPDEMLGNGHGENISRDFFTLGSKGLVSTTGLFYQNIGRSAGINEVSPQTPSRTKYLKDSPFSIGRVKKETSFEDKYIDLKTKNGKDKNARREIIISLVKTKDSVTIKDISSVIKGCSEKTLQRELLAMVEGNVLKKEGERRWSRYSLRA